jgi:hypothetical protein
MSQTNEYVPLCENENVFVSIAATPVASSMPGPVRWKL